MKTQMSFRLSDEACARLEQLKSEREWSGAHVVEHLLLAAPSRDARTSLDAGDDDPLTREAQKRKIRPVAEILAGEQLKKTINTPAAEQAVKQAVRRKTNPMTGKAFGAVPK